jgi:hypothetical protein
VSRFLLCCVPYMHALLHGLLLHQAPTAKPFEAEFCIAAGPCRCHHRAPSNADTRLASLLALAASVSALAGGC